ncbi:MAG: hypothetical protein L6Q99_14005 [Planctomycetes bacterium]|nr:hypothetical protein [Planctomycetota bacterium]
MVEARRDRGGRTWASRLLQTVLALVIFGLVAAIVAASVWPPAGKCPVGSVPAWVWFAAAVPTVIVVQHAL